MPASPKLMFYLQRVTPTKVVANKPKEVACNKCGKVFSTASSFLGIEHHLKTAHGVYVPKFDAGRTAKVDF